MNYEYTFATESEARNARREKINGGYSVSLIGFDPSRNLYTFDVII